MKGKETRNEEQKTVQKRKGGEDSRDHADRSAAAVHDRRAVVCGGREWYGR